MSEFIYFLQHNLTVFIGITAIYGLLVGSFLNVVIFRFPVMLFREWESMAKDVLKDRGFKLTAPKTPVDQYPTTFNLVVPRSGCPKCGHKISAVENLPIVSYLLLKGKCKGCSTPISIRYPMVELLTGVTFAVCASQFGLSWQLLISLVLTSYFVSMSFIDYDHQILPDQMTIPLVWLGLICGYMNLFVSLEQALFGAILGYLSLWSVYWIYKRLTGKEGMGHGDFKLLAAIGAFVGWQQLGLVIILSAGVGAILGILMILIQKKDSQTKIPFGPYLAAAGWLALISGDQLMARYYSFVGIY